MKMNDAKLYLPFLNVDPRLRVKCPGCDETFVLEKGVTIQGVHQGEPTTGFFCSDLCILKIVPVGAIGRC